jgi:hypothetical protein
VVYTDDVHQDLEDGLAEVVAAFERALAANETTEATRLLFAFSKQLSRRGFPISSACVGDHSGVRTGTWDFSVFSIPRPYAEDRGATCGS